MVVSSFVFENNTQDWGLGIKTHSNGAAYSDLDGDGDLDLIINNINASAHVYRNESKRAGISVRLVGPPGNTQGIGAKMRVTTEALTAFQEMVPVRGYLSTIDPILVFGIGDAAHASIEVTWPNGVRQVQNDVSVGELLTIRYNSDGGYPKDKGVQSTDPYIALDNEAVGIPFQHVEDGYVDFDSTPLLLQMHSREGPALTAGDLNQDGLVDVFVGGAGGQASSFYLQQGNGTFGEAVPEILKEHAVFEDVDAALFDYDGDGDQDVYVVSGGSSEPEDDIIYQDRLYENLGFGRLEYRPLALPAIRSSSSVVSPHDFDSDGDIDLFIGGRVRPGQYPLSPRSYILANTPDGFFDVTGQLSEILLNPGMVTDAMWADLTGDQEKELVILGEWMSLRVFERKRDGLFSEITEEAGLADTEGFWNTLAAADLDNDGDIDLVAGNRGLNTQLRASANEPASLHIIDLDRNGSLDVFTSTYMVGEEVLIHWRDEVVTQVPMLTERFPTHESYARATFSDIFSEEEAARSSSMIARMVESSIFENRGGRFIHHALPQIAQVAPVQDIIIEDVDGDSHLDLIIAGNDFGLRAAEGRQDAGRGRILFGNGNLVFTTRGRSGIIANRDVRNLLSLDTQGEMLLLVGNNDGPMEIYARVSDRR